jgi:hypothetical protein
VTVAFDTDRAYELIALAALRKTVPWWPFSAWYTAKLIREKKLGCVRMGRRVFVTRTLLQKFIASRVEEAADPEVRP